MVDWKPGDMAICIKANWINCKSGMPNTGDCPKIFGQYKVTNIIMEWSEISQTEMEFLYIQGFRGRWSSHKFIKLDDPRSIIENDEKVPVRPYYEYMG